MSINQTSKLVLIDGNAIMHRSYHALPSFLTSKKGEPINAVYGFVSMLLKVVTDLKPTHIAVCFDMQEPTFRHKAFKDYQAQRPSMEADLASQFAKAKDVIAAFGIPIFELAGYEADDLIGTLAKRAVEVGKIAEVVIVTGDRDILQLVTDKVKVYLPVKSLSEGKVYGKQDVKDKLGVNPPQVVDYKALVGDPSDNYPGVPGIGPKTATQLIEDYKSFPAIYKNLEKISPSIRAKLEKGHESGEVSYRLAKIVCNVPFEINFKKLSDWDLGSEKVFDKFREIGFKTLTNRYMSFAGVDDKNTKEEKLKKGLTQREVTKIVNQLAKELKGKQYAVRGTASLVLQEVDMVVDDIDVVCDEATALALNTIFAKELFEEIKYSESPSYKSFFGKLIIDNVLVEVMGNWQIGKQVGKSGKVVWGQVYDGSDDEINEILINDQKVRVTKPGVELDMFAQMGRWTAYQKIKRQLDAKNQQSLF